MLLMMQRADKTRRFCETSHLFSVRRIRRSAARLRDEADQMCVQQAPTRRLLGALEMDPHSVMLPAAEQVEVKNFAQGQNC